MFWVSISIMFLSPSPFILRGPVPRRDLHSGHARAGEATLVLAEPRLRGGAASRRCGRRKIGATELHGRRLSRTAAWRSPAAPERSGGPSGLAGASTCDTIADHDKVQSNLSAPSGAGRSASKDREMARPIFPVNAAPAFAPATANASRRLHAAPLPYMSSSEDARTVSDGTVSRSTTMSSPGGSAAAW